MEDNSVLMYNILVIYVQCTLCAVCTVCKRINGFLEFAGFALRISKLRVFHDSPEQETRI